MLARIVAIIIATVVMSCRGLPIDKSQMALAAGQSTMILGGCDRPLSLGWSSCQFVRGGELPKLRLFFVNRASYAVSDCNLQILTSGSTNGPQLVEVDLSSLKSEIDSRGFCILKVEAQEFYNGEHRYPVAGGFFIEAFQPGYLPTPTIPEIAWCYKVARTTSGRTVIEKCRDNNR